MEFVRVKSNDESQYIHAEAIETFYLSSGGTRIVTSSGGVYEFKGDITKELAKILTAKSGSISTITIDK